jgi:protein-S-isoprenylcysteine O-methyltransferase Ste14
VDPAVFSWLIYAGWALLIVYLIVAGRNAKRDEEVDLGQSFGLLYALIAAFALPYVPIFGFVNWAPVGTWLSIVGLVIFAAGIVCFVAARQELGRNWSQTVSAKHEHELVTSGPYRYVRHPMYGAGLVACVGAAIVVGGPFVFMILTLLPIFLWRVGAEDKLMTAQFPTQYPEYMQHTRALIPFVW